MRSIKYISPLLMLFTATITVLPASNSLAARKQEICNPIKTKLQSSLQEAPKKPVSCLAEAEMP